MDDMNAYAMTIHEKDDAELSNRRTEIFNYLLDIGADPNVILEMTAIDIEVAIRGFKKDLGLS